MQQYDVHNIFLAAAASSGSVLIWKGDEMHLCIWRYIEVMYICKMMSETDGMLETF